MKTARTRLKYGRAPARFTTAYSREPKWLGWVAVCR